MSLSSASLHVVMIVVLVYSVLAFEYDMYVSDSFSLYLFFFFQAEDGIRYLVRSRGLGDVYKRQNQAILPHVPKNPIATSREL